MITNTLITIQAHDTIEANMRTSESERFMSVRIAEGTTSLFIEDKRQAMALAGAILAAAQNWEPHRTGSLPMDTIDYLTRRHNHNEGLLEMQASHEAAEIKRMGAARHPSLLVALEDAYATAIEDGSDALLQLFYEQWIAGDPLAHAAAPEADIIEAIRPYWEAMRNDEY